ncbi:MAG: hypothetical protein S4CHLAM7_07900 [Chlamydiae bacterium]|nr:hypothetical protein [Chlamydiota bacterium]
MKTYFLRAVTSMLGLGISFVLLLIPVACLSAYIAYLIANIFPPSVRFTGVGVAMNVSDGIIGGLSPFISLGLVRIFHAQNSIIFYVFICAIISYIYYRNRIK